MKKNNQKNPSDNQLLITVFYDEIEVKEAIIFSPWGATKKVQKTPKILLSKKVKIPTNDSRDSFNKYVNPL